MDIAQLGKQIGENVEFIFAAIGDSQLPQTAFKRGSLQANVESAIGLYLTETAKPEDTDPLSKPH
jgi:hypothetical protein